MDLVVQPVNPKLFGANIGPFWVFRNTPHGYELLLVVDALELEILRTKSNGLRDIRTTRVTAREVLQTNYEYDGKKYR